MRIVKAKPRYAYGKIEKIISPSPRRITPRCPVASRCGGCVFQHCEYGYQLKIKKEIVIDALTRIGKFSGPPVEDVIGAENPFRWRNKAQFPVTEGGIGFYAPRSHRVVPVEDCAVQHESHVGILAALRDFIERYKITAYDEETHAGLIRNIIIKTSFHSSETMAVLVINGSRCPNENALAEMMNGAGVSTLIINSHTAKSNAVTGGAFRVAYGSGRIFEKIGGVSYGINARSFFQVNPAQTKILYDTALDFAELSGSETVLDAHAGAGGIALYAASSAKFVYGTEIVGESVAEAKLNAELNGIGNAEFIFGAAEDAAKELLSREKFGAVFFDPPRKGCEKALLDAVAEARVPKIIYVSCDPATLARDLALLSETYSLEKVRPVDMFPMTGKVECVCLLKLKTVWLPNEYNRFLRIRRRPVSI